MAVLRKEDLAQYNLMNTDWSKLYNEQKAAGASADVLQEIINNRNRKIASNTDEFGKYKNDSFSKYADADLRNMNTDIKYDNLYNTRASNLEANKNYSLDALYKQAKEIEKQYEAAMRQNDRAYDIARMNSAEQFANLGINQGSAAQIALSQGSDYASRQGVLLRDRSSQLSDMAMKKAIIERDFANALAKAKAETEAQKADELNENYWRDRDYSLRSEELNIYDKLGMGDLEIKRDTLEWEKTLENMRLANENNPYSFNNALQIALTFGVINEEISKATGLPVGATPYEVQKWKKEYELMEKYYNKK